MALLTSATLAVRGDASMDEEELEQVVVRSAAGDGAAWLALWSELEPWLVMVVASPRFLGRVGQREDDRANIVLEVIARLHADRFHRLRLYLETRAAQPGLKFRSWLRVVAKRVGIDYLRAHQNYIDRRRDGEASRGRWVEAGTLPSDSKLPGERPPVTNRGTVLELLRYAAASVPEPQLSALELWTQGASFDDIARELGVSEPEKLVRAAIERLRRRFREDSHE